MLIVFFFFLFIYLSDFLLIMVKNLIQNTLNHLKAEQTNISFNVEHKVDDRLNIISEKLQTLVQTSFFFLKNHFQRFGF